MPITQKTIWTVKNSDGVSVRVVGDTVAQACKCSTEDGEVVYFDPEDTQDTEIEVDVVFDDIVEDTKRTLSWSSVDIPDAAWRIVRITLFDGTNLVFSHPREAIHFLGMLKPLRSPKERDANLIDISEYRPKEDIK